MKVFRSRAFNFSRFMTLRRRSAFGSTFTPVRLFFTVTGAGIELFFTVTGAAGAGAAAGAKKPPKNPFGSLFKLLFTSAKDFFTISSESPATTRLSAAFFCALFSTVDLFNCVFNFFTASIFFCTCSTWALFFALTTLVFKAFLISGGTFNLFTLSAADVFLSTSPKSALKNPFFFFFTGCSLFKFI